MPSHAVWSGLTALPAWLGGKPSQPKTRLCPHDGHMRHLFQSFIDVLAANRECNGFENI
jgi:hypothetical protein